MKIAGVSLIKEIDKDSHPKLGKYRLWLCPYCKCSFEGTNIVVRNRAKRSDPIGHCGCQTKTRQSHRNKGREPVNKLSDKEATVNLVMRYCHTRKGDTLLTKEDVGSLIFKPCHYCGEDPSHYRVLGSGDWKRESTVPSHGIDRYDSNKGYLVDNCVPCCSACNYFKRDMHGDAFINLCKTISNRF